MIDARDARRRQESIEMAIAVGAGMTGKIKEVFKPPARQLDRGEKWW